MTPEEIAGKTEQSHQAALFCWCQQNRDTWPELDLLFHIPNGDSRGGDPKSAAIVGARLKAVGVKPGVPDLMLPVARRGYHGLFIELKVGQGKTSIKQDQWLWDLGKQGYYAQCKWGWMTARDLLIWYLQK